MDIEEFKKALSQVQEFTDEICLHLMGEPLAHPKITSVITNPLVSIAASIASLTN
jgi:hypothetical protein